MEVFAVLMSILSGGCLSFEKEKIRKNIVKTLLQ